MKFITPKWPAPAHIKAYTTTKRGWGEAGGRASQPEAREKLVSLLSLPTSPIWLKQTHSTTVVEALPDHCGLEADASISHLPNSICLVETADCLPVLICNREGTLASAIHAGWRGLANGIIENALALLPSPPNQLLAWLGPAIGPHKFEVGRDVYDAFVSKHEAAALAFTPQNGEKWLADLYQLARLRLQNQGVADIYGGEYCTHSQPDLFYSYRRDNGSIGRMASVIWIDKNSSAP